MGEPRRPIVLLLLGAQQRDWVVVDAEGPFMRQRTFLSALMPGPSAERRGRRIMERVWGEGWRRKSADKLPT
eukprot:1188904-Alexandrium_andersonii.AAC.1